MQSMDRQLERLRGVISKELYTALVGELRDKNVTDIKDLTPHDAAVPHDASVPHDLSVPRQKFDALQSDYDALRRERSALADKLAQTEDLLRQSRQDAEAQIQDWKQKADLAARQAEEQLADTRFEFTLENRLRSAGAKNLRAACALLDLDALRSADDFAAAIDDAVSAVRRENPFLFGTESSSPAPVIVASVNPLSPSDADEALRRAMGLQQ